MINKKNHCPICKSNNYTKMIEINCGNLDNSDLYPMVKINTCKKCGHIYNTLSVSEIAGLKKYYDKEYAPSNIFSKDKIGDRPGSCNKNTIKRYDQLYRILLRYIDKNMIVLDVGCAMAGFLNYLYKKGFKNLSGIDTIKKYIDNARQNSDFNLKVGSVESIPFNDNKFNLLIIDQVLEHLVNPIKAFRESRRVLKENGLLCIGIPDATRYKQFFFFDFFWFIMREHIQHFDLNHLISLATQEGFELVDYSKSKIEMIGEKMILPDLNDVFRKMDKKKIKKIKGEFGLRNKIKEYIEYNLKKLEQRKRMINKLIISKSPLYIWGIGREFLYLYKSVGLNKVNIVGLIDNNSYKQKRFTVDGKKIEDKSILLKSNSKSNLLISAVAHSKLIKKEVLAADYRGRIIEL